MRRSRPTSRDDAPELPLFPEAETASPRPDGDAKILIGTSGYSFPDWIGSFYPPGTRSADFLPFYAQHFPTVEINSTYYGIPDPGVMEQMERKTPRDFRFMVKLNKAMTHERSRDPALYRQFREAIEPLRRAGKYAGALAQFPFGFDLTPDNRRHLAALRDLLPEEPLYAEFRNDSWLTPDLEPALREHRIGFCAVDEPRLPGMMPPVTMLTTEDAYVRFHGRNAEGWYGHGREVRYDYSYRPEELSEWLGKVADLASQAKRTYLFFNNCHAGQAARSAKLMEELLRRQTMLGSGG
jgi:uncharacterized protein YecE (DUF72 family)